VSSTACLGYRHRPRSSAVAPQAAISHAERVADPLVEALSALARASHPAIFTPHAPFMTSEWPAHAGSDVGPAATDPALRAAFAEALGHDSLLRPFSGPGGVFVKTNLGKGWRVDASELGPALVRSAAQRIWAEQGAEHADSLVNTSKRALAEFRRLCAGDKVEGLVLTGFEGVALGSVRVELPWGALRAASPREREIRPFGRPPSAVLESRIPLRLTLGEPDAGHDLHDSALIALLASQEQQVALALLLAVRRDELVVGRAVWRTEFVPGDDARGFGGRAETATPVLTAGEALKPPEADALVSMARRVADHYDHSIEVAVRRTLSAVRERSDPEDALIDAVIAWENLFGHGESAEVSFRVTTALARLLDSDPAARRSRRSGLAEVYRTRGQLVHGRGPASSQALHDNKEAAIVTTIEAMRTLFEARPELIADKERGLRVIME
jgi:hypothetical protein